MDDRRSEESEMVNDDLTEFGSGELMLKKGTRVLPL